MEIKKQVISEKYFEELASIDSVNQTIKSLRNNGMDAELFSNAEEAKKRIFELIPEGAEVMNMASRTLDEMGVSEEIVKSGKYKAVKKIFENLDRDKDKKKMKELGSVPDFSIASAHAVTEDGKIIIASNTGSQLPAASYGAGNVIFVVGTQKIVENLEEGIKRIYEYVLPLESVRLNKQYNISTGSYVSKLLIINREFAPGRIKVLFVNEKLGF